MKEKNTISFHEFYEKYAKDMYAYGMAFNMGKDTVLDAIHDVFLHIIENENKLMLRQDAKLYLLVSLRNRLFSLQRKEVFLHRIDDEQDYSFSILVSGLQDTVEDEDERNEIISRVEVILDELTDRQREVIYLRYMQGLDYDDISEIMNISTKAVRKLNYRAISRIRELYGAPFYLFIQLLSMNVWNGDIPN